MDRRPRQPRSGRPIRRRQELVGLRHRPEGLPRQSLRPLSSLAEALRRPGARPGRRAPSPPDQIPRRRRSAHPRRLRPRTARCGRSSRPARNPRGAIRAPIDDRHLPAPAVRLARGCWGPYYADAILDRLVHNAHRIELTGESLRRAQGKQPKTA